MADLNVFGIRSNKVFRPVGVDVNFAEVAGTDLVLEKNVKVCVCEALGLGELEIGLGKVRFVVQKGGKMTLLPKSSPRNRCQPRRTQFCLANSTTLDS